MVAPSVPCSILSPIAPLSLSFRWVWVDCVLWAGSRFHQLP